MEKNVSINYPDTNFIFCEARDGMRKALNLEIKKPVVFDIDIQENKLQVSSKLPTFGPQPFLAIKTKDGNFFHDNFDFQEPFHKWSYVFDDITFSLASIEEIGIGTCDSTGNVTVANIVPSIKEFTQIHF